jgi:hypothetical protein
MHMTSLVMSNEFIPPNVIGSTYDEVVSQTKHLVQIDHLWST